MAFLRPVSVLVAFLGLLVAPLARADEGPVTYEGFLPSGQYVLFLDGAQVEGAKIHLSAGNYAYLVLADVFDVGVLVMPRRGCVEHVAASEIHGHEDGTLDVVKQSVPCSLGAFRLEGSHVVFQVGERQARLQPKPPLLGLRSAAELFHHSPEYLRNARAYTPDPTLVAALRASTTKPRIEVFFGSWCSFCNRFLPCVLRVEQELAGTGVEFVYRGLPPPPAAWVSPDAVQNGVKKLITGILTVDGKEIGRIVGNDWIQPEKALTRYLR